MGDEGVINDFVKVWGHHKADPERGLWGGEGGDMQERIIYADQFDIS